MMTRPRLSFTTSPQVRESIDALVWSGLWGRTRAEVCERLVCHALLEVAPPELLREIAHDVELDGDEKGNGHARV